MTRPASCAHLRLGQWICDAVGINDPELFYATLGEAKTLLIKRDYINIPDLLTKLNNYNLQFVEK